MSKKWIFDENIYFLILEMAWVCNGEISFTIFFETKYRTPSFATIDSIISTITGVEDE